MKVNVGQIWYVISEFWTSGDDNNKIKGRKTKVKIKEGEKIEIRYPFEWHFRTEDGLYFHADEEVIKENCLFFGLVNEDIKRENKTSLKNILLESKYTPVHKLT